MKEVRTNDKQEMREYQLKRIGNSRVSFDSILKLGLNSIEKGKENKALWMVRLAAHYAEMNHPGIFASEIAENMLSEIGSNQYGTLKPKLARFRKRGNGLENIVHIITESYSTGGHTRAMMNLIDMTKDQYNNYVIFTNQLNPPSLVRDYLGRNKIEYATLSETPSLVVKSIELRYLCENFADRIVLHIHMDDPVPSVAFSGDFDIPVLLFNHADHLFWIGNNVSDTVLNIRPVALELSNLRRTGKRNELLPIPIGIRKRIEKRLARQEVGIPPNKIVIATMASDYKFTPFGQFSITGLIEKIMGVYGQNLVFIAIGAVPGGNLQPLKEKLGDKVILKGPVDSPNAILSAADIYMDSFPLSSTTSALDAAALGLPVFSLRNPSNPLFGLNDISFLRYPEVSVNFEEAFDRIRPMIEDTRYREELGISMQESVMSDHSSDKWVRKASELYKSTNTHKSAYVRPANLDSLNEIDLALSEQQAYWKGHQEHWVDVLVSKKQYNFMGLTYYAIHLGSTLKSKLH